MIKELIVCAAALAASSSTFVCQLPEDNPFGKGKVTELPWMATQDGSTTITIVKEGIKVKSGEAAYVITEDDMQAAHLLSGLMKDDN